MFICIFENSRLSVKSEPFLGTFGLSPVDQANQVALNIISWYLYLLLTLTHSPSVSLSPFSEYSDQMCGLPSAVCWLTANSWEEFLMQDLYPFGVNSTYKICSLPNIFDTFCGWLKLANNDDVDDHDDYDHYY